MSIKIFLQRLRTLARNWRDLGLRKIMYIPHILGHKEKRFFLMFMVIAAVSGSVFLTRIYLRVTKPVPGTGGSYTEGLLKEPRNINPLYASQDTDRDIARLVYSGLFTYTNAGELATDLAEKYDISPDGRIYTITLKKNAYWHDGKKLSADDVFFTVKTIQNPQYKSVLRANWLGVGVEKVDQYIIRFVLRSPYAPFMENLTMGVLPRHIWENIPPEQAVIHEMNLKPVGSGPYKFDSFKQAKDGSIQRYSLLRNSRYYDEGPYIDEVNFVFLKSEDEAVGALHKKLIDGFGPLSASRISEFDRQKVSLFSLSMPRIFGIFLNERKNEILKDKAIREAIAYAINRGELSQKATSGGVLISESPLPFLNYGSSGITHEYNPEKARQILDKAGWKTENSSWTRSKKTVKKGKTSESVQLKLKLTTSDWPDLLRTAELIQKNLKSIGIDVSIEKKTFSELEQSVIRPRDFELLLFGQVYGHEADPYTFWHSSQIKDPGLNITSYSNKKADGLLEELRKKLDQSARNKKYEEFVRLIQRDMPAIFIYAQLYTYLLPSDIQGADLAKIALPSDRFNEINKWYIDTDRSFRLND